MTTLRLGVIGDPVTHSVSPAMQQAAFDFHGIDAVYERWPTSEQELADRVASLRAPGVLGANVTVPHKQAVIKYLDEVTPLAQRAGAVNTISHIDGRLIGDNTDVHGFAEALVGACPNARVRTTLVLGAGGAARGVVLALEALGVKHITVANRSLDKASQFAEDLAPTSMLTTGLEAPSILKHLTEASILVNTTSLGWNKGETSLPVEYLSKLPPNAVVVDLTYRDTLLLQAARERGLATLDGLPMLVHQGARAFEIWTGKLAPLAEMMAAADEARQPAD